eukprot:3961416-Amphidinium_carterae.1
MVLRAGPSKRIARASDIAISLCSSCVGRSNPSRRVVFQHAFSEVISCLNFAWVPWTTASGLLLHSDIGGCWWKFGCNLGRPSGGCRKHSQQSRAVRFHETWGLAQLRPLWVNRTSCAGMWKSQ